MQILAVDPGPERSAWVALDNGIPKGMNIADNGSLVALLSASGAVWWGGLLPRHLVIEMPQSYGMPVGKSILETCYWIGRFEQAWGGPTTRLSRKTVCACICHDARAKKSNIRQALIDRFPPTGGGKTPQIGTKKKPGPLYGIKGDHLWDALALGLTYFELQAQQVLAPEDTEE